MVPPVPQRSAGNVTGLVDGDVEGLAYRRRYWRSTVRIVATCWPTLA